MWKWVALLGSSLGVVGAAILALTNPSLDAYVEFAEDELVSYLQTQGCQELAAELGSQGRLYCGVLLNISRPAIAELLRQNTEVRNFLVFSLYETELSLLDLLEIETATLGIGDSFVILDLET
ncbi:MAG: DUF4359 domain-containing protein [Cyanobacteria bacterium P01_H01_bin.15]